MKKLLFGSLALASITAFAQDYDAINQKNADIINTEYSANKTKTISKMKRFFIADFSKTKLPASRKLQGIEKMQKELIRCVTKSVNKNKAGYDGPLVLQKVLLPAMVDGQLSHDESIIAQATSRCWKAYDNLYSFNDRAINVQKLRNSIRKLSEKDMNNKKIKSFLSRQYLGSSQCKVSDISAVAGFGPGVGMGVANLKCLMASGKIRNYLGIKLQFGGHIGVKIEYSELLHPSKVSIGKAGAVITESGFDIVDMSNGVIGLGTKKDYSNDIMAQSIGAGVFSPDASLNMGIRFFNGKRNWSYVLDQLN